MLYAAKCYWPGVTEHELQQALALTAVHADQALGERNKVIGLGTLLFPNDALALSLFEATSKSTVMTEAVAAGMPCDRVMELVWLPPQPQHAAVKLMKREESS